jgi:hypothetical protein
MPTSVVVAVPLPEAAGELLAAPPVAAAVPVAADVPAAEGPAEDDFEDEPHAASTRMGRTTDAARSRLEKRTKTPIG